MLGEGARLAGCRRRQHQALPGARSQPPGPAWPAAVPHQLHPHLLRPLTTSPIPLQFMAGGPEERVCGQAVGDAQPVVVRARRQQRQPPPPPASSSSSAAAAAAAGAAASLLPQQCSSAAAGRPLQQGWARRAGLADTCLPVPLRVPRPAGSRCWTWCATWWSGTRSSSWPCSECLLMPAHCLPAPPPPPPLPPPSCWPCSECPLMPAHRSWHRRRRRCRQEHVMLAPQRAPPRGARPAAAARRWLHPQPGFSGRQHPAQPLPPSTRLPRPPASSSTGPAWTTRPSTTTTACTTPKRTGRRRRATPRRRRRARRARCWKRRQDSQAACPEAMHSHLACGSAMRKNTQRMAEQRLGQVSAARASDQKAGRRSIMNEVRADRGGRGGDAQRWRRRSPRAPVRTVSGRRGCGPTGSRRAGRRRAGWARTSRWIPRPGPARCGQGGGGRQGSAVGGCWVAVEGRAGRSWPAAGSTQAGQRGATAVVAAGARARGSRRAPHRRGQRGARAPVGAEGGHQPAALQLHHLAGLARAHHPAQAAYAWRRFLCARGAPRAPALGTPCAQQPQRAPPPRAPLVAAPHQLQPACWPAWQVQAWSRLGPTARPPALAPPPERAPDQGPHQAALQLRPRILEAQGDAVGADVGGRRGQALQAGQRGASIHGGGGVIDDRRAGAGARLGGGRIQGGAQVQVDAAVVVLRAWGARVHGALMWRQAPARHRRCREAASTSAHRQDEGRGVVALHQAQRLAHGEVACRRWWARGVVGWKVAGIRRGGAGGTLTLQPPATAAARVLLEPSSLSQCGSSSRARRPPPCARARL